MCITALILGIVSLVFFCLWYVSIPCGILAIIFGIMGIKSEDKPMAITGLVTGAIGLIVSILLIFIIIVGVAAGISSMNTGNKDIFKNNIITDKYDFDIYD